MSDLLDVVGQWLIDQGIVGGTSGWPLYKGFLPPSSQDDPTEKCIALFETPGDPPDVIRDPSIHEKTYDNPGLQVRGRSAVNGYQELRVQLQLIFDALHQNEPTGTSGEVFVYMYGKTSAPLQLGKDGTNRDEMSWNFTVMRERETIQTTVPLPDGTSVMVVRPYSPKYITTTILLPGITGMTGGDVAYCTDTGQSAYYDDVHLVWNFTS